MKNIMNTKLSTKAIRSPLLKLSAALGLAAFLLAGADTRAANLSGNGSGDWGGPVGEGTLTLSDDGTTISASLDLGNGQTSFGGGNDLVIYVDNGLGGGFSDTSGFSDSTDENHNIISGYENGARSLMTFMSGFAPQYAISLSVDSGYGGIWKLADGGNGSLIWVDTVNFNFSANPYTFSFPVTDIGLTAGSKHTIELFGSLISWSAYRSKECLPGNDSTVLGDGNNPFTQTAYGTYVFDAGAPTLTPVTFQVDMTEQIANGTFTPGGSQMVEAAGSFQTSPWSGFVLTAGMGANANIYTGIYQDENPVGTVESYKFFFTGSSQTLEGFDNRSFTLQTGGQTLSTVYFNDLWPSPSATTNYVTFQIDMTSAIAFGTFSPGTETIEVFGTCANPQWAEAGLILKLSHNNIYTNTFADGNYPGTFEEFKYVIVQGANDTWEYTPNRQFYTPSGSTTLPLAYFDNINNVVTENITFQVDMTSQIASGVINISAGDTVGVAGTFQNPAWSGATLSPSGSNPNIFTGTFPVTAALGGAVDYKFIYTPVSTGTAVYESPASTSGNNRAFAMPSTALTLPVVFWADEDPNNILLQDTEVTFTVDMTGAVDDTSIPFTASTDDVVIDVSFPIASLDTTAWPFLWTDPLPSEDTPDLYFILENSSGNLYQGTYLVSAGNPLQVQYKYGIYHNAGSANNGTLDNEAPFGDNHSRYIRAVGAYSFPTDVFGQQVSNPTAANEISFGNLVATLPSPGTIALTWLGRPGVYLQSSPDLSVWTTIPGSGGLSSSNISTSGSQKFFRLVNP
jgi:hypothetical protein